VFPGNSKASTAQAARKFFSVLLQFGQVVEGIGSAELARVDEAHEEVAYVSPVLGLVEECVFAVEDRFLQGSFAQIIIQRGPRLPQKQSQLGPMILHVADGLCQAAVGLHSPLRKLFLEQIISLQCQVK